MIEPITANQRRNIVNCLYNVFTSGNIEFLNKPTYNFLYLASGFIAHYNLFGFRDYYSNVEELKNDILMNKMNNQWGNFSIRDKDYAYYMSKKDTYNAICDMIEHLS